MTTQWMAIPQGRTEEEVIECAHDIERILGRRADYWGVPRWMANAFGTRSNIVRTLQAMNRSWDHNIHLLGMSHSFDDDIRCLRMEGVIGIDSANPLVLGQRNRDITENYQHISRTDGDWNYWNETKLTEASKRNMVKMRSLCGD